MLYECGGLLGHRADRAPYPTENCIEKSGCGKADDKRREND